MWRTFYLTSIVLLSCGVAKSDGGSSDGTGDHDHDAILARLDALEVTLADVQTQVATNTTTLEDLSLTVGARLDELDATVSIHGESIATLPSAGDLSDLAAQVDANTTAISDLSDGLSTNADTLTDLGSRVDAFEAEGFATEAWVVSQDYAAADDLETLSGRMDDYTGGIDLSGLETRLTAVEAHATDIAENASGIAANTADITTIQADLAEVTEDYVTFTEFREIVEPLSDSIAEVTGSMMPALSAGLSDVAAQAEEHNTRLTSAESHLDGLDTQIAAHDARLDSAETALTGIETRLDRHDSDVATNAADITANSERIEVIEDAQISALSDYVYVDTDLNEVVFTGANVLIQSGSGYTDDNTTTDILDTDGTGTLTGLGNLIIGYNEKYDHLPIDTKSGSHNLVIGPHHSYTSFSAIVAGQAHDVSEPYTAAVAGEGNHIQAQGAGTLGGNVNEVTGEHGAAVAGYGNQVDGQEAGIFASYMSTVGGDGSSVTGGSYNTARATYSSVTGGYSNTAESYTSVITGGEQNTTYSGSGASVVVGGEDNWVTGYDSVNVGGVETSCSLSWNVCGP